VRLLARDVGSNVRNQEHLTVSVVTVDDQAVFRRVAREVIEATPGFELFGEAASGEEALALADEVEPDLVLIDVRMPGMNGVETASRLAAAHPTSTIVLVSSEDRSALPTAVECCGVAALLCKEEFGTTALRQLWALHGPGASRPAPR
jgi:DNA-binding NarL/FixJ family response regulator